MMYNYNKNKNSILFAIFIIVLILLPQIIIAPTTQYSLYIVLFGFLLFISWRLNTKLFTFFIVYLSIINIVQIHILNHWGGYNGDITSRLEVAFLSPRYETKEYIQTYVNSYDYFILFYSFMVLCVLFYFLVKYKKNIIIHKVEIIFFIILLAIVQNKEPLKILKKTIITYTGVSKINNICNQRTNYLATKQTASNKKNVVFYDKIIIIIGESANKNHLNIYGYNKQTTPFLSNLKSSNKLYIFNAIASANQTRYAVPMLMTNADVKQWKVNFTSSQSILSDFQNNGYKTYWISNQGMVGIYENYITHIAKEANQTTFFNKQDYSLAKTDIVIKKYLYKNDLNTDKELYIFHLIGSHMNYEKRYDKKHKLIKNPKTIIDHYDNSIYFTDYIIKEIINHFDKKHLNILVAYVSDHSEVVTNSKSGHGYTPSFADEYKVPFVIYSNITNSRIHQIYQQNKMHYFNLENFNDLIKYISYRDDNFEASLSSNVISVDYNNIVDCEKLKLFKGKK